MSKHLTPAVHASWLYRLPEAFRRPPEHRTFEFPARPSSPPVGNTHPTNGACGEFPTGAGLPMRSPAPAAPVPVGHLTLVERIKVAAEKLDDIEEDCE